MTRIPCTLDIYLLVVQTFSSIFLVINPFILLFPEYANESVFLTQNSEKRLKVVITFFSFCAGSEIISKGSVLNLC